VKKYLLAGLLTWLPLAITVWVLLWVQGLLDGVFKGVLGGLLKLFSAVISEQTAQDILAALGKPGVGVLVMLLLMLATGAFVTNLFGQWWVRQWDMLMSRIPIVKSIYNSVKQVSDTLFSSNGNAFREAVLVQWPHAGSWTIGFVTGTPVGEVVRHLPADPVSVYVPTTPNPTGGYFVMMPRSALVPLKMSVDEALKYIISMGVVEPPPPAPAPLAVPQAQGADRN
jgi:uncharacterized membrane protein